MHYSFLRYEIISFWSLSLLGGALVTSIKKPLLNKGFSTLFLTVLVAEIILDLGIFYFEHTKMSPSLLFIFIETNSSESFEFLRAKTTPLVWVVTLIPLPFVLFSYKKLYTVNTISTLPKTILIPVLILLTVAVYQSKDYNLWYRTYSAYSEYQKDIATIEESLVMPHNSVFEGVAYTGPDTNTLVIIIGESTGRRHMGIYGYHRPTTPRLSKTKDQYLLFTDVISPYCHTIESLERVLTLKNNSNQDNDSLNNGSIIQLFNMIDFRTYWISNQKPIGVFETALTSMAQASDITIFTDNTDHDAHGGLDAQIFPSFTQALSDSTPQKIIFIHLKGTHIYYKERYPESFDHFTSANRSNKQKSIDEYDNAILYQDFLLDSIITLTRSINPYSSLIFFSDHGEDIYDEADYLGHSYSISSKPMYEIPFLIWPKNPKTYSKEILSRPYMIDNFIYTLADLAQITLKTNNDSLSILNDTFTEQTRKIGGKGTVYQ
ncbi:MAG: sulfatase-like hydrolase/transferase [Fibrobacterales bacterium]